MKKLFLITIMSLMTSYAFGGAKETPTHTNKNSICLRKGLDMKAEMKKLDELVANSTPRKATGKKGGIAQ